MNTQIAAEMVLMGGIQYRGVAFRAAIVGACLLSFSSAVVGQGKDRYSNSRWHGRRRWQGIHFVRSWSRRWISDSDGQ